MCAEPVRIIACGVFRSSLEQLKLQEKFPILRITYLPPNLHLNPSEIEGHLIKELETAEAKGERAICLYGNCFRGIDALCQEHEAIRVKGHHCYEMLLGKDIFSRIVQEHAGTYFLERELIMNFEEYCVGPLELFDKEMRELMFKHYDHLLYVQQPTDPDLQEEVRKIANFLGLTLQIRNADYRSLEKAIIKIIESTEQMK